MKGNTAKGSSKKAEDSYAERYTTPTKGRGDIYGRGSDGTHEPTLITSMKLRVFTRDRLKLYAMSRHTTMGDVVDRAINAWIESDGSAGQ